MIALEHVPCPRCGADDAATVYRARDVIYGVPGEYTAARCRRCALWFQNPRPTPASLPALYPSHYGPHAAAPAAPARAPRPPARSSGIRRAWRQGHLVYALGYRALAPDGPRLRLVSRIGAACSWRGRWEADVALVPRLVPGGRLLELGAGSGERLARLRDLGWRDPQGIELVPSAADAARDRGLDVITAGVEDALAKFPDGHFDVIVASMVLEHLLDPFATMRLVARKLKPGGQWLFSTVVRDSLDGWIFGAYGVSYDFPRHMVFFRTRDLALMLAADFDVVRRVHDATPIDFERPARLRGRRGDGVIVRLVRMPGALRVVRALAYLGLMGRVSFRCRRRAA